MIDVIETLAILSLVIGVLVASSVERTVGPHDHEQNPASCTLSAGECAKALRW